MTTPQTMVLKWLIVILTCFASGFLVRGYMAGKAELKAQVSSQAELIKAHEKFEAAITKRDELNQELNTKLRDAQLNSTKVLNEQLSENARLAADLGVAQRMSLRGTTCPSPTTAGSPTSPGMVDEPGLVLSAETRQLVFDLRGSLLKDAAQITGLQDHVAYLEHQIADHQRLHDEALK